MIELRVASGALVSVALLAGCVSSLPDELALTAARTRESSVKASENLALAMERMPRTLDEMNRLLGASVKTTQELSDPERGLAANVSRVSSATAGTIDRLGGLAASLDSVASTTARLLDEARRESQDTREERVRIVASVGAITSSIESLARRAEEVSRGWSDDARDLRVQQARATKALADLSESTARAAADLSKAAASFGRVTQEVEPHVGQATKSVATILADVAKITERLSSDDTTRKASFVVDAAAGGVGALIVVMIVIGVKLVFRRAVDGAVAARLNERPRES